MSLGSTNCVFCMDFAQTLTSQSACCFRSCSAFHKREVEKHFVVCKHPVEREYGVTHYMLCEVTRQLCYRAFVLGLVQSPADYLAWRTMSRTQALPQRGQGSKTRSFPFASQSFYKLYHVPAVSGAVQRQGRRRERGGCASLQPV